MKYTLELGGKSKKTLSNYRSHITRFLNYFEEDIEINKPKMTQKVINVNIKMHKKGNITMYNYGNEKCTIYGLI